MLKSIITFRHLLEKDLTIYDLLNKKILKGTFENNKATEYIEKINGNTSSFLENCVPVINKKISESIKRENFTLIFLNERIHLGIRFSDIDSIKKHFPEFNQLIESRNISFLEIISDGQTSIIFCDAEKKTSNRLKQLIESNDIINTNNKLLNEVNDVPNIFNRSN